MAGVAARLGVPVTATVVRSFGSFKLNQQVIVDRVTADARILGIARTFTFLPRECVDERSLAVIDEQYQNFIAGDWSARLEKS